ncbi:MAG TPA: GTPase domain-containing protein [Rhodocyclaceae bacterium]|nr:GTPase domain-containing protein [Rhodocyclaceae bacterium]
MNKIRVLVFGATGSGKTSLCNVLTGLTRPTDNDARGVTSKSHAYVPFTVEGHRIELIDTVGLHESTEGTVPADKAIIEIVELLKKAKDGFSLLIHVSRATRITKEHEDDYAFFVKKMTRGRIPVILAVAGCENEDSMGDWVERNRSAFASYRYRELIPCCFASAGPLEAHYVPLREQSREALMASIVRNALLEPEKIYGEGTGTSFSDALSRIWNEFVEIAGLPQNCRRQVNESAYDLMKRMGVPKAVRDAAIAHIPDLLQEVGNRMPVPFVGRILKFFAEKALGATKER